MNNFAHSRVSPVCILGPGLGMGNTMLFGYGFGGLVMFFLFLAIVGVFVYLIVCHTTGRCNGVMKSRSTAMDILKERYAKGEINKEEFEQMKKDIQ